MQFLVDLFCCELRDVILHEKLLHSMLDIALFNFNSGMGKEQTANFKELLYEGKKGTSFGNCTAEPF